MSEYVHIVLVIEFRVAGFSSSTVHKYQIIFQKVKGHSTDPDAGILPHSLCDAGLHLRLAGHVHKQQA